MKIFRIFTGCFSKSKDSLLPNEQGLPAKKEDSKTSNESKWPRHPFYKRIFNHRYKLLLLPLLGFCLPSEDTTHVPPQTNEKQFVKVIPGKGKTEEEKESEVNSLSTISKFITNNKHLLSPSTMSFLLLLPFIDGTFCLRRRYLAAHELGHFLASKLVKLSIEPGEIYIPPSSSENPYYRYRVLRHDNYKTQDAFREQCERMIISKAGGSLNELTSGVTYFPMEVADRFNIAYFTTLGILQLLCKKPTQLHNFILFRLKLEGYTQELLKQRDPKVVEDLAKELAADGSWDEVKLGEIIERYKLNHFPKFEEEIPELKRLLEALKEK